MTHVVFVGDERVLAERSVADGRTRLAGLARFTDHGDATSAPRMPTGEQVHHRQDHERDVGVLKKPRSTPQSTFSSSTGRRASPGRSAPTTAQRPAAGACAVLSMGPAPGPGPIRRRTGRLPQRPVQVAPPATDLEVGLIDIPAITRGVPTGPGGVGEQRGEPLHPAEHRDVIHLDAALGQQLLHIAVGEPVPQLAADGDRDHLSRELEPGEGGPLDGRAGRAMPKHGHSLPHPPNDPTTPSVRATVPVRAA
jgi:hypothetical protein